MFTGALIMRVDGTTGGAPSALWKLVVNTTSAFACNPDSAAYRSAGRCFTLPTEWADYIGGDGLYGGDYAKAFNFTALYELESDPYETTDLQASRPDVFARALELFADAVRPMVDAEYTCGCECETSCDSLYTTWADTGDCFVVPWETPGETHKGKHDDKHDNHRRLAREAARRQARQPHPLYPELTRADR